MLLGRKNTAKLSYLPDLIDDSTPELYISHTDFLSALLATFCGRWLLIKINNKRNLWRCAALGHTYVHMSILVFFAADCVNETARYVCFELLLLFWYRFRLGIRFSYRLRLRLRYSGSPPGLQFSCGRYQWPMALYWNYHGSGNLIANRFETAQHAFSPTSCNLGRVALRAVGGERLGDLE